jgi:hypothetical protein
MVKQKGRKMKYYILIVDVNGTVLKSKHPSYDTAMAKASSYRSRGYRISIKVVQDGEILN